MGMREDSKIYGRRGITSILELEQEALAKERKKSAIEAQKLDDEIDLLKIIEQKENEKIEA